ncbi:Uma2 family endonuclease [Crocosphaera watsonii]|uniref:Uma2 family endonuclease n=1 Tax=Crocosphaera watsonii TaxID=263511 RepID=UPI0039C9157C
MIIASTRKKYYTPQEYLELEINSENRHEYINGEIVSVTGGTPNHNQICLNLSGSLNFALMKQPYRVFVADQRIWIPEKRIYAYPDVMVVEGKIKLQEGRKDTIINPLFIAEVLSDSTKKYDIGDKFAAYRTIPTFQEYILIAQDKIHLDHYYKTEPNKWIFSEYEGENTIFSLTSIPFQIYPREIYTKVDFQ